MGAALIRPYIAELVKTCGTAISYYPDASLPSPVSETGFDKTSGITSGLVDEFALVGLANLVGGCCDTTSEHIKTIADRVVNRKPHT